MLGVPPGGAGVVSVEVVSVGVVSVGVESVVVVVEVVSVVVVSVPVASVVVSVLVVSDEDSDERTERGLAPAIAPAAMTPAAKQATRTNETFSRRRRRGRPLALESISPTPL